MREILSRRCQAEIVIYHCMGCCIYIFDCWEIYGTICINVSSRPCITEEVLPKF